MSEARENEQNHHLSSKKDRLLFLQAKLFVARATEPKRLPKERLVALHAKLVAARERAPKRLLVKGSEVRPDDVVMVDEERSRPGWDAVVDPDSFYEVRRFPEVRNA